MKQYKNTVQTIQNTVNTSTHITKTPPRYKTHIYTHPHITKPTHTHTPTHYKTHTYAHSHITKQVEKATVQDTHQTKYFQCIYGSVHEYKKH